MDIISSFENQSGIFEIHGIEICNHKLKHLHGLILLSKCYNIRRKLVYDCLNFSFTTDIYEQSYYYIFVYNSKVAEFVYFQNEEDRFKMVSKEVCRIFTTRSCLKGSWREAQETCQEYGGHLPVIRSKDELDEIIGLFYTTKFSPPIMMRMFIGMVVDKVCKCYSLG